MIPTPSSAEEPLGNKVQPPRSPSRRLLSLSIGALGVVYGDIGTSPLYAVRECFTGHAALGLSRANVLGVLSLIFWSLILVVSIKYLAIILRADNQGEGGILALMALVQKREARTRRARLLVLVLGIFGAALLYGDGVITPAISVLSAIEGIAVLQPGLHPHVVPLSVAILILLFLFQRRGTGGVGAIFGPITFLWFVVLAVLGLGGILRQPAVLLALDPLQAVSFFASNGGHGFLVLGAIFLVVTGSEALYADMGHFGTRPIRVTWFAVVLPALLVNYFGQGALLIADPAAAQNPFYLLAPEWAVLPLVVLATAAACIASQAVISGAFSLTRQAVQLGFCPRLAIVHTSVTEQGQIYVPAVNWGLLAAVIAVVIGFRSSSSLAAAYGIAVSSTMVITTVLALFVARGVWGWRAGSAASLFALFFTVDLAFLGANAVKLLDGGWFPLALAAGVFVMMTTWKRGREILGERIRRDTLPVDVFLRSLRNSPTRRVGGTAVFMTGNPGSTPPALLHNLKHSKIIHERVVLFTVQTTNEPHVAARDRVEVQRLEEDFYQVQARYGFMETPDIPDLLEPLRERGLELNLSETSFFLGRETLLVSNRKGMMAWRKSLFEWLSRNARPATIYFKLPPNRVVEVGAQLEL